MLLPSIIHHDFLTEEEIKFISDMVYFHNSVYDDIQDGVLHSYYYTWRYYNSNFKSIRELLDPKFKEITGMDLLIDHSHILDSRLPYSIHSDYYQRISIRGSEPAYTFIIPLDDYDSNTLAFEQYSSIKSFSEYLEIVNPEILPLEKQISPDICKNYLGHVDPMFFPYLSLKEIFHWKKGSVYMCDRKHFHTSDNYTAHGVSGKKAFIFWTSLKTSS